MLISGFVDGKLIYILEFPFKYSKFVKHLEDQLRHRFEAGKDITGQFLRSASFDYRHFINSTNLRIVYILSKNKLKEYEPYIVKGFYEFLEGKAK
jgi:hypothetical protein